MKILALETFKKYFLTAGMSAVLLFGLCAVPNVAPPVQAATMPVIEWQSCPFTAPSQLECGTMEVPLNYAQPEGEKINIAVSRIKARKPASRQGVMLLNPGGPGSRGLDLPLFMEIVMPQSVRDRYDLIGFDPRGIGRSAPVSCGLTQTQALELAPPIQKPQGFDATATFAEQVATGCGAVSGTHLPHITTANTARDMDRIRQALGEPSISYYGVSYGTYLGAVYASLFPDRTQRFVLDSSTGPNANWRETFRRFGMADQSRFPDFTQFAAANNGDYGLGATPAEVRATYFQLFNQLTQNPIPLPDLGIDLNGEWFRALTFGGLYSDGSFDSTARLWRTLKQNGPTGTLTSLVLELPSTISAPFPNVPADNFSVSTLAVLCDDTAWSRNVEQYRQELIFDTAQNPIFGPVASNIWACAFWPNHPVESPVAISSTGPRNIMIVQNLRDPATPLIGAQEMHTALGQRAQLLTVDQGGHGASYGEANECSVEAVTDYFVTGILPAQDTQCAAETNSQTQTEAEAAASKELRRRR